MKLYRIGQWSRSQFRFLNDGAAIERIKYTQGILFYKDKVGHNKNQKQKGER